METVSQLVQMPTQPATPPAGPSKIFRIFINGLIAVIGLSAGAVMVHGMVLQQCPPKNGDSNAGIQKCLSDDSNGYFIAGVLPSDDNKSSRIITSAAPGANANPGANPNAINVEPVAQNSAPVVEPRPTLPSNPLPQETAAVNVVSVPANVVPVPSATPVAKTQTTPVAKPQTAKVQPAKAAPKTVQSQKPAVKQPAVKPPAQTQSKPSGVNLDKLSIAIAMTETHNCQDKVGSAVFNNCHGFKKNGQFMHFETPAQSHVFFKQMWAKSYKTFPSYRQAQVYSGSTNATQWLKNVTYYYNKQ